MRKGFLSKFIHEITALWCTAIAQLITKLFARTCQKKRNNRTDPVEQLPNTGNTHTTLLPPAWGAAQDWSLNSIWSLKTIYFLFKGTNNANWLCPFSSGCCFIHYNPLFAQHLKYSFSSFKWRISCRKEPKEVIQVHSEWFIHVPPHRQRSSSSQ